MMKKELSKELVGASTIPIILSIISKKESYGYEIIQEVKNISDEHLDWAEGTLYPVLHKLEKKKLIESFWRVAENGRKRKYYRICKTGKEKLISEKENWNLMNSIITRLWNIEPNSI